MKQKISNRILCILNIFNLFVILGFKLLFSYNNMFSLFPWVIETKRTLIEAMKVDIEQLSVFINMLVILFFIVNFVYMILNIKNKKIMLWLTIPTLFYLEKILQNIGWNMDIFDSFCGIMISILLLIATITEIKKDKRKVRIVLYILGIIISIPLLFAKQYELIIWFIIANILIFIYSKEINYDSKNKKIINLLLLIVVIIAFIANIYQYSIVLTKWYKIDKDTIKLARDIIQVLENEKVPKDPLILVKDNNKLGLINASGNELIPCEYDAISSAIPVSTSTLTTFEAIFIGEKNNTYDIFSRKGTMIATGLDVPTPFCTETFINDMIEEAEKLDKENFKNIYLLGVRQSLGGYISQEVSNGKYNIIVEDSFTNDEDDVYEKGFDYLIDKDDYTFMLDSGNEYDEEDLYEMEIKEITNEGKCNLIVKKNNQIISNINEVYTSLSSSSLYKSITTYTNGDIPFFNLKKRMCGFYSMKDMQPKIIHGNYRILDIIGGNIILRDYNDLSNLKDYVINMDTNEIMISAKEIHSYSHGFIVKNNNDKVVYLDNNFNQKTEEYDYIWNIGYNLLICRNKSKEFALYDLSGNKLTKKSYQIEDTRLDEFYRKEYLLEDEYNDYYFNNTSFDNDNDYEY